MNGRIAQEIRSLYSRLIQYYEGKSDRVEQAKAIYNQFLNLGLHAWVDPEAAWLGTIEQRLAKMQPQRTCPEESAQQLNSIWVIEPEQSWGRPSDAAIDQVCAELATLPANCPGVVLAGRMRLNECRFPYSRAHGAPLVQIHRSLTDLCRDDDEAPPVFQVQLADVQRKTSGLTWIILKPAHIHVDTEALAFGLEIIPMNGMYTIIVHLLLFNGPAWGDGMRSKLRQTLRKKPQDWLGYTILESAVIDVIKQSAYRVAQQCGESSANGLSMPELKTL